MGGGGARVGSSSSVGPSTPPNALYEPVSPDCGFDDVETSPTRRSTSSFEGPQSFVRWIVRTAIPAGGVASSAFNLCCSTLGASTIGLPGGMKACGIVVGCVLLVIFAACTVVSVRLLCVAAELSGLNTYEDMARQLLGRFYIDRISTFVMIIFCWGSGVSYIVATSDLIGPLLKHHVPEFWVSDWGVRLITALFWTATMLPLALMREINSLRYVSAFGVLAIVYFIIVMVAHSIQNGLKDNAPHLIMANGSTNLLVGVGLIMFTFCCQPNVPEVYSELKVRTPSHMTAIAAVAMGCCTVLYLFAGIFGYADFGSEVHGSILKNYNLAGQPALYVAYSCLAVKLTAAHTLCIAPTRDSLLYTFKLGTYHAAEPWKRMLISAVLSLSALLVALFIPSLQLLFGFLGSLCGSLLGFVFPALFAWKAPGWSEVRTPFDQFCVFALIAIGAVVFVLGTATSIYEAATS